MIMKKYFIFAAIATAGLFASCSSDDNITANEVQPLEDQDGRPAIQIGVGSLKSIVETRGTGSAGSTTQEATNIWRGERVHVLMYQVDETTKAPTFDFTMEDNTSNKLYDDAALLVTPLKAENLAAGIAKEPTDPTAIGANETFKVKYYPVYGQSDFWGYYLGGYGTDDDAPAGDGAVSPYTYTAATQTADAALTSVQTTAAANVMATDFTIDGTHDLLVGQAPIAGSAALLATMPDGLTSAQQTAWTAGANNAYSAKAARQGIQPNITFKHLLSRLKFKAVAGNAKANGVRVNAIKVRSKATGKMIVAYKYTDGTNNMDEPDRIIWNPTQAALAYDAQTLPQLELKQRATYADDTYEAVEYASATHDKLLKAYNLNKIYKFSSLTYKKVVLDAAAHDDYNWEAVAAITITTTYNDASTDHADLLDEANADNIYKFSDGYKKVVLSGTDYVWNDVDLEDDFDDASTAHGTLLAADNVGNIYVFSNGTKKVVAVPVAATYKWEASTAEAYNAADADEKMIALTPVAMEWAATTPGTLGTTTTYDADDDWATADITALTALSGTYANYAALLNGAATEADGDYKCQTTDGKYYTVTVASNVVTVATELTGSLAYAAAKGTAVDNTTLANLTAAQDDAKTKAQGDYFYVTTDGKYYKINVATGAVGGGVAKEIGEALLVAPQDKYEIEVDYEMDRYTAQYWYTTPQTGNTPGDYVASDDIITGQLVTDLVRTHQTNSVPDPFEAGSSYLITITLYGPEQIVIKTTLTAWEQGDQDIEIGKD